MPVALVTGAGIRVGKSIALALAAAGYDLVLHANKSASGVYDVAAAARDAGRVATVHLADLSDPAAVDALGVAMRAAHPVLDAIVHNAGVFEARPFDRTDRTAWRRTQAINLDAPFFLTQALLPSLRAAPAPVVIHLADVMGERPTPGYAAYAVTKAGLIMLTRALAVELGPHIRVNAIAPGTVIWPDNFDTAARAAVTARIPLGRAGSADDVARAVLYLIRDAGYVTGQTLAVDGGRSSLL